MLQGWQWWQTIMHVRSSMSSTFSFAICCRHPTWVNWKRLRQFKDKISCSSTFGVFGWLGMQVTGIRLERNAINNVWVCVFVCLCVCVCLFVCVCVSLPIHWMVGTNWWYGTSGVTIELNKFCQPILMVAYGRGIQVLGLYVPVCTCLHYQESRPGD